MQRFTGVRIALIRQPFGQFYVIVTHSHTRSIKHTNADFSASLQRTVILLIRKRVLI